MNVVLLQGVERITPCSASASDATLAASPPRAARAGATHHGVIPKATSTQTHLTV